MSNPSIYSGTFTARTNLPATQLSTWQSQINNHDHGPINGGMPVVGAVPIGGIIMWYGTIATIPSGWALCNGSSGTPNLTDRFVICADSDSGGTYVTGQTGNGSVINHNHVLTDPGHNHNVYVSNAEPGGFGELIGGYANSGISFVVGAGTGVIPSTSGITIGSYGGTTNVAVYYALAYIMRTV